MHVQTYVCARQRCETQTLAVFKDRPTRTVQVDIHVLRAMHAELATRCDNDAILDIRDVYCACDLAADNQRVGDFLEI